MPITPEATDLCTGCRDNAVVRVCHKHAIELPRDSSNWRVPGKPLKDKSYQTFLFGHHRLVDGLVTLLITNGVVGYFLLGDHSTTLHGSLANFTEYKEPKPEKTLRDYISVSEDKFNQMLAELLA